MSFQNYIIQGRICRDLELKVVGGTSLCKFTVAFTEREKDKNGTPVDVPQFWDVDVWGAQADNCGKFLSKGKPVLIAGKIKQRKYEDKNNQSRTAYSITASSVTFLGGATNNQDNTTGTAGAKMPMDKDRYTGEPSVERSIFDDPFAPKESIEITEPSTGQGKLQDDNSLPF